MQSRTNSGLKSESVMILDGDTRIGLAIARCLGRRRVRLIIGGPKRFSRAFYSRYCSDYFVYPADSNFSERHACLLKNMKRYQPDVLFPILNRSFALAIEHKEEYSRYTSLIMLPEKHAFMLTNDKSNLPRIARNAGIVVPRTLLPENEKEAVKILRENPGRYILKPRVSAGGFGACWVNSPNEVHQAYACLNRLRLVSLPNVFFDSRCPLLQEYIEGQVVTFFAYSEKGHIEHTYMTETLRNYPVPFGPGVCVRSIKNKQVYDFSAAFLNSLKWDGIIGLQYIIDRKDGLPKLIDVNPRFWGTVESAISAGVDFPYILLQKARGRYNPKLSFYEEHKKFRWILFGDLLYALQRKGKFQSLKNFLSDYHTSCEISLKDIKPHIVQVANLIMRKQDFR